MKIIEKFIRKSESLSGEEPITIAFLGDSVTQGCFEAYVDNEQKIQTVFDKNNAYHSHLAKLLNIMYPSVPVNMINAGISGGNATAGFKRLERDVLRFSPDLVVVCFGLNDCMEGADKVEKYAESLSNIFDKIKEAGAEVMFMTPNMMNTKISPHICNELIKNAAEGAMERQKDGTLDLYIEKAKEICAKKQIIVCDCYKKWKVMEESGIDITELLANKINHPTKEMNWLFAISIFETMLTRDCN